MGGLGAPLVGKQRLELIIARPPGLRTRCISANICALPQCLFTGLSSTAGPPSLIARPPSLVHNALSQTLGNRPMTLFMEVPLGVSASSCDRKRSG